MTHEWPDFVFRDTDLTQRNTKPLALELANEVREDSAQPFNEAIELATVLRQGSLALRVNNIDAVKDDTVGMLFALPDRDRFDIVVDPRTPKRVAPMLCGSDTDKKIYRQRRKRHITCHEIGHTFSYIRAQGQEPQATYYRPPHNDYSYSSEQQRIAYKTRDGLVEKFCEEFARQLLVPKESLRRMNNPERVAKKFNVSLALAALSISGRPMVIISSQDPSRWFYVAP